jgi:hypothetical protein
VGERRRHVLSGAELRARALFAGLATLLLSSMGQAGERDIVPLPAALRSGSDSDAELVQLLPRLDHLVSEAAQDLGLTMTLEPRGAPGILSDEELVQRARASWVVKPELSRENGALRLRLVAVAPGSKVLRVRSELATAGELEVRVAVMMRDLVRSSPVLVRGAAAAAASPAVLESDPRSSGRAVLALNAAVFGGFVGYSFQASSGSSDARLVYPLVALGAGVGLGASMLVADEWNVTVGGAWFLSAGAWWPLSAGMLLASAADVPLEDRYVYGVAAGAAGVSLATAAASLTTISEGDAALAHTGGVFGMGLGGLSELLVEGSTRETPTEGLGLGAAIGSVSASLLATQLDVSAPRLLLIDLGATLGAVTGAAAASPLLLVDEQESRPRTRLWLGSVAIGGVLGAGVGWWATRHLPAGRAAQAAPMALPYARVDPSHTAGTHVELGVTGRF